MGSIGGIVVCVDSGWVNTGADWGGVTEFMEFVV